jgi:thiol-disulfide isomerase/thioredoxin
VQSPFGPIHASEIDPELDRLGAPGLSLEGLRGRFVLLDFWTFGCINCIHVAPMLAELERRFPDTLTVIGVHAGKFPFERVTEHIAMAMGRLDVRHPVINDRHYRTWRAYAIEAWPSIALVAPDGRLVGTQSGEFDVEQLAAVIAELSEQADAAGLLVRGPGPTFAHPWAEPASPLRFPARAVAAGGRLYVSDAGNHRVLELAVDDEPGGPASARVLRAWGAKGDAGFADGAEADARFRDPQGLAVSEGALWVADRGNHAVRRVALDTGAVATVAGTGRLGVSALAPGVGTAMDLRSPWDVEPVPGGIAVAMAGSHQLWLLGTGDGRLSLVAGSGREDVTDGPATRATLAQPTGMSAGAGRLCFTDAESSAVRYLPLAGGRVTTVTGTGLFDHGDVDGAGTAVRMEHVQDCAWLGDRLYVADTYNRKIKVVDPVTSTAFALPGAAGSGEAFAFPTGVAVMGDALVVVDADAHAVMLVNPGSGAVRSIAIEA